ncbi:MAG: hypothetical protein GY863_12840 [bacterium]|nr:hypothetical protein [bacterium]
MAYPLIKSLMLILALSASGSTFESDSHYSHFVRDNPDGPTSYISDISYPNDLPVELLYRNPEEPDRTKTWNLKTDPDINNAQNFLEYPEVGAFLRSNSGLGVFITNRPEYLHTGQPLIVVRDSADQVLKIANIKLLRRIENRAGFEIDHLYTGRQLRRNDRIRLLFPEMSRLNLNSKSWLLSGTAGLAAAGYFHFMRIQNDNKYDDAQDSIGRSFYGDRIESYNRKRDAALIMGGLNIGASVISQVIWGRHNSHLYQNASSINTSTKSLVTFGLLSFGSALYFDNIKYFKEKKLPDTADDAGILYYKQQIIINRFRRNVSMMYGATALSAALLNHFLLRGEMDVYREEGKWSWLKWNPVSKSNLVYTALSAAAATYLITRRNMDNSDRNSAETDEDRSAANGNLKIHQHRGNAVLIGAGTFLLSGIISQVTGRDHIEDSFTGDSLIPLPGFLSNRKFETSLNIEPGRNAPGLSLALNLKFKQ